MVPHCTGEPCTLCSRHVWASSRISGFVKFLWQPAFQLCSSAAERETGATILSCIAWIPGFLKYYVVPYPIKFLFMLLWLPVRHVLFNVHKRVVVQCCKVDAFFSGKPKDIFKTTHGAQTRFDRAVFLQRLHGERNLLQDLWYWANLAVRRNK